MDQVRIIFASLFPAFLVVTAGQGLSQIPVGPTALRFGFSISARQPGRGVPSGASQENAVISRNFNRRPGAQSGSNPLNFTGCAALADSAVVPQSLVFAAQNRPISWLSCPWHFRCRAAAQPRAPSSVT